MNYLNFKKEMIVREIKFYRNQITTSIVMLVGSLSLLGLGSCILFLYGLSITLNIVLGSLIPNCIWSFVLLKMSLTDYKLSKEHMLRLEEMEDK